MSNLLAHDGEGLSVVEWKEHASLLAGAATATLICLKILAVAQWDMNTAFGILAENGIANVLTGSLLAVLPTLSVIATTNLAPAGLAHMAGHSFVGKISAVMLIPVIALLLVVLAPAFYLVFVAVGWLVLRTILWVVLRILKRRKPTTSASSSDETPASSSENVPSSFDKLSILTASILAMTVGSLSTPWLPPEIAEVDNEKVTVYVLNSTNEKVSALIEPTRSLVQLDAEHLTGDYCRQPVSWLDDPVPILVEESEYPECPN